jgi:hypothetical protein
VKVSIHLDFDGETVNEIVDQLASLFPPVETVKRPEPAQEIDEKPEAPTMTVPEARAKVYALAKTVGPDVTRDQIKAHGANVLDQLDPAELPKLIADLEKLAKEKINAA